MSKIRVLSPEVADRIAAGEVVERPASVVKELVENSLDAGARHITVEIRGGGLELIKVTDDGEGMTAADLSLAFTRHATSKIHGVGDLVSIRTLGFRGEALASISSVGRVETITRHRNENVGNRAWTEGGGPVNLEPAGSPPGTVFIVRDLFFNTPARKKFLKAPRVEAGKISLLLTGLAMAHPEVGFRFTQDEREYLNTPGDGVLLNSVTAIYGAAFARQMLPVQYDGGWIRVAGFVGAPTLHRGNRWEEWFFLNGRVIEDPTITHALEHAFHTLLPPRRFPAACLTLDADPEWVDVNVHPTKHQVRFARKDDVHRAVFGAVREVMEGASRRETAAAMESPVTAPLDLNLSPASEPLVAAPQREMMREAPAEFGKQGLREEDASDLGDTASTPWPFPQWKYLGQVHQTYLVLETAGGLVLVDQHAAHERVILDQLLRTWGGEEPPATQPLLVPVPLPLAISTRLDEAGMARLRRLGFEVEEFGANTVLVRSIPQGLRWKKDSPLADIIQAGLTAEADLPTPQLQTIACRGAIKAGEPLAPAEAEALLKSLSVTRQPMTCAHGRPSLLTWSWDALERSFYRR